ncbi:uncharacterized protein V2V93DRAFT_376254 [Kockiozyma suomiensis]|uniref:uncharacterized protein n=1 Tax=Kockiozyma suomiensis TaxID=1337062 RepID=UPI0033439CC4
MTIYRSHTADIPLFHGSLPELLLSSPYHTYRGHRPLMTDAATGKTLTIADHFRLVRALCVLLKQLYGVQRGTVVGLLIPNDLYLGALHHAILWAGGVISPVNSAYLHDDFTEQMRTAHAGVVIAMDGQWLNVVHECRADLGSNCKIVSFNDLIQQAVSDIDVGNGPGGDPLPLDRPSRDTLAYLCFSSGTTGKFKGVMTSHYNLANNILQSIAHSQNTFTQFGIYAGFLPQTHVYGLQTHIFITPYLGAQLIIMPRFNLEEFLAAAEKYHISHVNLVPPIMVLLAKSPVVDKYPNAATHLQVLISGAAPLSESLAAAVAKRLGEGTICVCQGYGMTETSPVTHAMPTNRPDCKIGTIGTLVPNIEARLVDPEKLTDVPVGEAGELIVRGPNVMMGYLENETATRETLIGDGWMRTGDIAMIDKDGYYTIVDRAKEMIKSKGFQVAPAELEALLLRHPDVADAAVIGHWSESEATERPRAFVVMPRGGSAQEVHRWVDAQVAKHKRLYGGIVVLGEIPKSPSGKILRRLLRERKGDVATEYKSVSAKL